MKRIPVMCQSIDNLLGGGIENGSVTLLYGEAGTGKTNICLQMAYNVAKEGKKVAYIDTEGLSADRIAQIFADESVTKNLLVFSAHTFDEQSYGVTQAARQAESADAVGLIVVDSMTMFYRLRSDDSSVRNELTRQTEILLNTARKNDVAVLMTSQVYTNIGTGTFEFLGGHVIHHNAKTIIRLEKRGNGKRAAVIVKHRSLPEGRSALYRIVQTGIED
ncbi:MAG: DNA repair and recombination protein RadB [Methanomassiliicoccaceae archaeon]|nr:DNA repair and recombination protein RadB [Methanomassiliicoccaceae archaeon]